MSKVSIEQFMAAREMAELVNLRFVDERNLRVSIEPTIDRFNKKDVLCRFTPGEQPATVPILEELLAHAKAGRESRQNMVMKSVPWLCMLIRILIMKALRMQLFDMNKKELNIIRSLPKTKRIEKFETGLQPKPKNG